MTRSAGPSLPARQESLLALVHALGGTVGNLDFQKLLFLYCMEAEPTPYDFVPYKFGAFSFASYQDRRTLTARGLIDDDDRAWTLTTAGRRAGEHLLQEYDAISEFAGRHRRLRGDALVAESYRRHPYYATRSEIAARLLAADPEALQRIASMRPQTGSRSLMTIGYEGRTLEGYLNAVLKAGGTILCDVRRNPLSRKYGFSKKTLANACVGVGVRYEHLPELGIASEQRRNLHTDADYAALFAQYTRDALPNQTPALEIVRDWVGQGERVVLTCFERSPDRCHRHCVADELGRRFGGRFAPGHL